MARIDSTATTIHAQAPIAKPHTNTLTTPHFKMFKILS